MASIINLRSKNGEVFPLSESLRFIEIGDSEKGITHVIYKDNVGEIHVVDSESPKAEHYRKTFGVQIVKEDTLPRAK